MDLKGNSEANFYQTFNTRTLNPVAGTFSEPSSRSSRSQIPPAISTDVLKLPHLPNPLVAHS